METEILKCENLERCYSSEFVVEINGNLMSDVLGVENSKQKDFRMTTATCFVV